MQKLAPNYIIPDIIIFVDLENKYKTAQTKLTINQFFMNIVKKIVVVIAFIIALPLVAALFVPKQYTVSVSETINKPKKEVYDYLVLLKNQEEYSEWVKADPNLHPTISGIDGTVGAKQSWNSRDDNVGEGEQTITALTEDRIDVDIKFIRPFKSHAKAANIFKALNENQTEVISEFYAKEIYPLNLMSYLFGRGMIKKTEIQNLKNIKQILER
ncbi:MAG TPA: SRPBCC family protein [Saprospiraceae bacterium]|nr:SRPBCC family protein [Saprospiraceae bacterium]